MFCPKCGSLMFPVQGKLHCNSCGYERSFSGKDNTTAKVARSGKEKPAETTATLKRDTKAIAEGVKEGLSRKESVNLNKASKADLQGLPGVTPQKADRIVAERPYANTRQLVTRHVLSEDEYAQVKDRVIVTQ